MQSSEEILEAMGEGGPGGLPGGAGKGWGEGPTGGRCSNKGLTRGVWPVLREHKSPVRLHSGRQAGRAGWGSSGASGARGMMMTQLATAPQGCASSSLPHVNFKLHSNSPR